MASLSHTNTWLHDMLTSEGACSHEHVEAVESLAAFDRYISESHIFIVDATGTIVHSEEIDWDVWRWVEEYTNSIYGDDGNGDEPSCPHAA